MWILNCSKDGERRPARLAIALLLACAVFAGCASSGGGSTAPSAGAVDSSELANALTPDGYPNINVVPRGETVALSNADKAQLLRDLSAARARQARGDTSPATAAEIARLIRLARLHGVEAIAEIEDR